MTTVLNLPIGISSFERIREKNDVYVDKTRYIFEMVSSGDYYFLSRPRRFGKSLTISTLKCLFAGNTDLFAGLWITEKSRWDWKAHPVITIDFNELGHQSPDELKRALSAYLSHTAEANGITLKDTVLPGKFAELITALSAAAGVPVVVLVDEYDKPIISHLGKDREALETAKQNRDIMKYFFGVLKGTNVAPCLRFVFFTGVSKFSRVSIFSELNNLNDITMNRRYAEMLGYTQNELETCFAPHIDRFARECGQSTQQLLEELKRHYNGYRFSESDVRVYNPFSILRALNERALKNYWFETGTPTFLVNLLRDWRFPLPLIENLQADETVFSTYEPENLKPEAILFQTGYITITDVEEEIYTFGYPNREVKSAFLKHLVAEHIRRPADYARFLKLGKYLEREQIDAFFETVRAIFADIPYALESKRDEAYFHTLFYLMVSASGARARSEVLTCEGRIDLVVTFDDKIFIIEFKCNQSADAALRQIHENRYADPFRQKGKRIILMGIGFDAEKRNVAEWRCESV